MVMQFRDPLFASTVIGRNPTNIYLFRVSNRNNRKRCEICSKFLVFLLFTLNKGISLGKCLSFNIIFIFSISWRPILNISIGIEKLKLYISKIFSLQKLKPKLKNYNYSFNKVNLSFWPKFLAKRSFPYKIC